MSLLRLGHVAVISTEAEKLMKFYQEFLGFWYTDDIAGIANFFTCNRDHHVVNIVNAPESRVHHIAFELRGTAHHTASADTLRKAGFNQLWGPSRHTAGHNIAGYHYDPNQVMVEFYTEMDVFIPELGIQEPRPWHGSERRRRAAEGLEHARLRGRTGGGHRPQGTPHQPGRSAGPRFVSVSAGPIAQSFHGCAYPAGRSFAARQPRLPAR